MSSGAVGYFLLTYTARRYRGPNRFLRTCSYRRTNPPDRRLNFLKHSNGRSLARSHTWRTLDKSVAPTISACRNACARRQSPVRMQVGRPRSRGPLRHGRNASAIGIGDRCNAIKGPLCIATQIVLARLGSQSARLGAACNYCEIRGARVHARGRERSGDFSPSSCRPDNYRIFGIAWRPSCIKSARPESINTSSRRLSQLSRFVTRIAPFMQCPDMHLDTADAINISRAIIFFWRQNLYVMSEHFNCSFVSEA